MTTPIIPPHVRTWLYGIAAAAGTVAITYGVLTSQQVDVWLHLADAILVTSSTVALAYRPTRTSYTPRRANDDGPAAA